MAGDPNFDIGEKSGGLSGLGGLYMPQIPSGGQAQGGPSKRRPFARKNPGRPSIMHQMTSSNYNFSHQTPQLPSLPGAHSIEAPVKPGTGPGLFPQGSVDRRGLNLLGGPY